MRGHYGETVTRMVCDDRMPAQSVLTGQLIAARI
jgi:hypothetical protein